MNFKALKWTFSSFSVFPFEQKCHIKGQKLKFDFIKARVIVFLDSKFKNFPILFKTFICWEAFSTANIKAVRGSLWWLSVNKLSPIPKSQSVSAVYENQ